MIWLVILGACVSLFGTSFYIRDTLKGETKPNRVTWFMWSIAPMIATAAALSTGVTWAALPVFTAGFGPFLVLLSSFVNRNSYWKLETFDYLCGAFSVAALVLWALTKDANIAVAFAVLSDASAAFPTVIKSYHYPETETAWAFLASTFSAFTSLLVIQQWTFASYAFPSYLLFIDILLTILISRKYLRKRSDVLL